MKPAISERKATFARVACAVLLSVAISGLLSGQQARITVNSSTENFGRPVYDAIQQLQNLTTIPINYEDLQYNFSGDLQDINSLAAPAQPGAVPRAKVLVPKGGSFSVDVPVDPSTGKLPDAVSVNSALSLVIAAAQTAGIVPGAFRVDSSQPGVFFVEPSLQHGGTGIAEGAHGALDTPVTVSFQQTVAQQVLDAIFQQVASKTGARFEGGSGTLALGRPWSKVSITASNEPAKYVLAKLLGAVFSGQPGTPGVSYEALFEPQQRYYVFNIQVDAAALSPAPGPLSQPRQAPANGQRLGKKATN